jgi:hypothetical protein
MLLATRTRDPVVSPIEPTITSLLEFTTILNILWYSFRLQTMNFGSNSLRRRLVSEEKKINLHFHLFVYIVQQFIDSTAFV